MKLNAEQQEAFENLYRLFDKRLRRLAKSIIRGLDADAAAAIATETWERAARTPARLAELSAPGRADDARKYLFEITRNLCFKRLKATKRDGAPLSAETKAAVEGAPALSDEALRRLRPRDRATMQAALQANPDELPGGADLLRRLVAIDAIPGGGKRTRRKLEKTPLQVFMWSMRQATPEFAEGAMPLGGSGILARNQRRGPKAKSPGFDFKSNPKSALAALRRAEWIFEGENTNPAFWSAVYIHAVAFLLGPEVAARIRRALYGALERGGMSRAEVACVFNVSKAAISRAFSPAPPAAGGKPHADADAAHDAIRVAAECLPVILRAGIHLALSYVK